MFDAVPVNANETVVVPAAVPAAAVAVNDALAVWPELTFIAEGLNVMPVAAHTRAHVCDQNPMVFGQTTPRQPQCVTAPARRTPCLRASA